jgi:Cof subfamily protein (haloacid dehalogenase superfamily)
MLKLIVSDLDGTLLSEEKQLPTDFWEVESQLVKNGILFCVASGRQFYNMEALFEPIKHRTLFVSENGTYVSYKGELLYLNVLQKKDIATFIEIGRKITGANIILCGKHAAYVESSEPDFIAQASLYYERLEKVERLDTVDDQIMKVTICDFISPETNSFPFFEQYSTSFKVVVSGKIWLDITNKNADKGAAIEMIQEKMNITSEHTMVFGDYLNDLEMMASARYSYAMRNAHPEIIRAAKFVTLQSNNENGVTKTIKKYFGW